METIAMDYTVVEPSKDGFENILVLTDVFTKYAWAIPTRDQHAITIAKALVKYVLCLTPYECPMRLHSDQGRNFEAQVVRDLCNHYGIKRIHTTPYHPTPKEMGNARGSKRPFTTSCLPFRRRPS
ncbi:uncharacterized protein LOC117104133 [Anneissia japonica]|uniref:uncharacterized protein LOC117104133 n=1 Tax=Anneissia japonica TaxID=1529436 RepID=UPI0014255CB1|nr:uncharacterized protein LOC117104133 [Anneissia japonica]